jgi:RNA polymerase sigma-70 factor, ECF subfamily
MSFAGADSAEAFEPHRCHLIRLAYRLLGSVAEAEDVVQEAFLRWHATDRTRVENPRAYLVRTVTRLGLDYLKSARNRRETYIGPWLPEPILQADDPVVDDVTLTLMLALERLSPLERAAFLLHDVFDMDFGQVGKALGRSEATCRQLASRARQNVRQDRPRFALAPADGQAIADAFFAASRSGDLAALEKLLAVQAVGVTDGGGQRPAALNPILGRARLLRFFAGLSRKAEGWVPPVLYRGTVNGLPGYVTLERDGRPQCTVLDIGEDGIAAIYIMRNPDKLQHLPTASAETAFGMCPTLENDSPA